MNREAAGDAWKREKAQNLILHVARCDRCGEQSWIAAECAAATISTAFSTVLPALKKAYRFSMLSDPDWVAVNTIIEESVVRQILPKTSKPPTRKGLLNIP